MESCLSQCLHDAVVNAKNLKSKGFDWSNIDLHHIFSSFRNAHPNFLTPKFDDRTTEIYCKAFLEAYDNYHNTMWGVVFSNLLCEYVMQNIPKLNILDIGCGKSTHYKAMSMGLGNMNYVSIDKLPSNVSKNHYTFDIFDETFSENFHDTFKDTFDIVIIDIEPHGKEVEIYNRILPCMKNEHIVFLKCIGAMDLYGSGLASNLLLENKHMLHSYFGMYEFNYIMRDVVAVMKKDGCTEYKGMVLCDDNTKYRKKCYVHDEQIVTAMTDDFIDILLRR